MTHGYVAVVAAEEDLLAGGDYPAVGADAGVDRGLGAAFADGLYLRYRVRELQKAAGAGEHMREEVRPQAEAEDGDVELVDHFPEPVYLLGGEELRLVGYDHVALSGGFVARADVVRGEDDLGMALEADAALYYVRAVSVVHAGLYEPDGHAHFLVVELGYKRLGALARAHRAVFEVQLSHFSPP